MIVNQYGDLVVNSSGESISIEPIATQSSEPAQESSTDWSPIIDALTSMGRGRQQPTQMVAPTGVPDWVWLVVPVAAGVLVLTLVLASARGSATPRMSGYRRKRRTRRH